MIYSIGTSDNVIAYEWFTESPTKPGWYWVAMRDNKKIACVLVTTKSKTDKALCIGAPGFEYYFELSYFDTWLGPLPEPEFPKGKNDRR